MLGSRIVRAALVAAVVSFLFSGSALADGPDLAFRDERALTLTWDQVETGVAVSVCNDGTEAADQFAAQLTGFAFVADGSRVSDGHVLDQPGTLPGPAPGECVPIPIDTAGVTPDRGDYTGELVVFGPGIGIIRRQITISKPPPLSLLPITSAVGDATLTATRKWVWGEATLEEQELWLTSPPPGTKFILPRRDTFIGVLHNAQNIARIYIDGPPDDAAKGVVRLPIRIDGLNAIGTYSGKVDLTGTGKDQMGLSVSVRVTDAWWWPMVAIFAGVLLAIPATIWSKRWLWLFRLKRRRDRLVDLFAEAKKKTEIKTPDGIVRPDPGFHGYETPSEDEINKYRDDLKKAVVEYTNLNQIVDPQDKDFKKLVASLEDAEKDAHDFAELRPKLSDLEKNLQGLSKFLVDEFPLTLAPAVLEEATGLLKGERLPVGGATHRVKEISDFIDLIPQWEQMARRIKRYDLWGLRLAKIDADRVRPEDAERLAHARAKIGRARFELLNAKDAKTITDLGVSDELKRAYGELADLGGRYQIWELPDHRKEPERKRKDGLVLFRTNFLFDPEKLARFDTLFNQGPPLIAESDFVDQLLLDNVRAAVQKPKPPPGRVVSAIEGVGGVAANIYVNGLAVVAAVVAGMSEFYFGKTWGTLRDFVVVAFTAGATQTLTKTLTENVVQLVRPLRST